MSSKPLVSAVYKIEKGNFENAGDCSTAIRKLLKRLGIKPDVVKRVAIAVFEGELNVCMYAHSKGEVQFSLTEDSIKIIIEDWGVGIPDLEKAMIRGWSTATDEMRELGFGAGLGMPNMKDNADSFQVESEIGNGTKIMMSFKYL